jgi:hypothetical protein
VTVTDVSRFVYVDTAFGGVNRRNDVKQLDEVRLNGVADCYVSHNRATVDLLTWRNSHKNANGNPTVAGFDGPTWADNLHLDYDNEADPGQALIWLRQGLDWFEAHGVELRALRIYFSGYKGFGVEVPHTLFGGFEPAVDFHKRLGRAAKRILGTTPYDRSVYDKIRLWRLVNSRHSKSGLYKIRLTVAEARTRTIDEIRALATSPRDTDGVPDLAPIPDDEWSPVDDLVVIWEATVSPDDDEGGVAAERRPPTNEARDRLTVSAIATGWPQGGQNAVEGESATATVSRHSEYLMPIIGFLATRTVAEHVQQIVVAAAEGSGDHLLAALAVWRYAEQSARWIFADAVGDPTADAILGALRRAGPLSRNDLVNLFDRHVNRARIERALTLLLTAGSVRREEKRDTGGRPAELWHAV